MHACSTQMADLPPEATNESCLHACNLVTQPGLLKPCYACSLQELCDHSRKIHLSILTTVAPCTLWSMLQKCFGRLRFGGALILLPSWTSITLHNLILGVIAWFLSWNKLKTWYLTSILTVSSLLDRDVFFVVGECNQASSALHAGLYVVITVH